MHLPGAVPLMLMKDEAQLSIAQRAFGSRLPTWWVPEQKASPVVEVFGRRPPAVPDVRAGANITVTRDAQGYLVAGSAGGAVDPATIMDGILAFNRRPPAVPEVLAGAGVTIVRDARGFNVAVATEQLVDALRAYLPHPPRIRESRAGKLITVTEDARGYIVVTVPQAPEYYQAHVQGGGGLTPWYVLGTNNNNSLIAGAVTANTLYACPFIAPARGATLDRIGFAVTTLLAGNGRCGIYNATSDTNLYPSSLVVDGGSISTATTGAKTTTISQALTPGNLYWAAYLGDAAPSLRCHQAGTATGLLGVDSTLTSGGGRGIQVALAFAALPATFTAGATITVTGSVFPAVFGRYGA